MQINLAGPLSRTDDRRIAEPIAWMALIVRVLSKPTPPYFDSIFLVRQAQAKGLG